MIANTKNLKAIFLFLFIPIITFSQDDFKLCDSGKWIVYFAKEQGKERYKVESKLVKETIKKQFKSKVDSTQNGHLTFRFFVNCHGRPGNYSILQVDKNYNDFQFDTSIVQSLLNIVKSLDIYKVKNHYKKGEEHKAQNYFIFFTFKIKHGEIESILP